MSTKAHCNRFVISLARAAVLATLCASAIAVPEAHAQAQAQAPTKKLLPRWREHIVIEQAVSSPPDIMHRLLGKIGYDDEHTQKVLSPLPARVTRVLVKLGAEVKRGQALLELDAPELAAITAQKRHSELDVQQSEAQARRALELLADGAISAQEAALAKAQAQKARAEQQRLVSHLDALSLTPLGQGRASLVAGIDGRITQRDVHAGQQLRGDEHEALLIISDLRRVWVSAELHEQEIAALPHTGNIVVRTPSLPHRTFEGRLEARAETLDMASRTLNLRGVLDNPGLVLRPGMAAAIELPLASEGVWVSQKAVLFDADGPYVVLVERETDVRRQNVVLGIASAFGHQQILDGLNNGARVIGQGALLVAQALGL